MYKRIFTTSVSEDDIRAVIGELPIRVRPSFGKAAGELVLEGEATYRNQIDALVTLYDSDVE